MSTTLVPAMTSNTTPAPFVASASTAPAGNQPWQAFDRSSGYWQTQAGITDGWLRIDLGTAQAATAYQITPTTTTTAPRTWTFEGSQDGESWSVLDSQNITWSSTAMREFTVPSPAAFRFYRLNISVAGSSWLRVNEFQLIGAAAPSGDVSGSLAATLGNLSGTFAGEVTVPAITGTLVGALPSLTGSFSSTPRHDVDAYPVEVLKDNPLGYFRLGEPAGTPTGTYTAALVDSSGNNNYAEYHGSPILGAPGLLVGDSDTSMRIPADPAYAYGSISSDGIPGALTAITLEALVNPDARTGYHYIFRASHATLLMQASGVLSFWLRDGSNTLHTVDSTTTLSVGQTAHVVGAYAGGVMRLYVNGVQEASKSVASKYTNASAAVVIGASSTGAYFRGRIDEVAVYGTGLSSARIADHYRASIQAPDTNPEGELAGVLPALTGTFDGYLPGAANEAVLAGSLQPFEGWFEGASADLPERVTTDTRNRAHGRTRVAEWTATVDPPVAEIGDGAQGGPVSRRRQRAHDYATAVSLPSPTMVDGRPT